MISKRKMTLFFSEKDQLSNWYIAKFDVSGVRFNCVEQFMMYRKAKLFCDDVAATRIMAATHPRTHKAIGRGVLGFKDEIWCAQREGIVLQGCYAKFSQNPGLRDTLLGTRKTMLVEASPYDRIWGVGLAADDPRISDPRKWRGKNLLGRALMETRDRLVVELSSA